MMNGSQRKLSLHQLVTYQIRIPGQLGRHWSEWTDRLTVTFEEMDGYCVSTLTGSFDQAALQGLLRHLYSLGLPLISVIWVEEDEV